MKHAIPCLLKFSTLLTICALSIAEGSEADDEDLPADPSDTPVFSTKTAWYNPPPQDLESDPEEAIPQGLVVAVPLELREAASELLEASSAVLMTPAQVATFYGTPKPTEVIDTDIRKLDEKIRFFQENPTDPNVLKQVGVEDHGEMERDRLATIKDLQSKLNHLKNVRHSLKPFLTRGVSVHAPGTFSGALFGNDLLISFTAMGSGGGPLENVPVVVFSPRKPRNVYTGVSAVE